MKYAMISPDQGLLIFKDVFVSDWLEKNNLSQYWIYIRRSPTLPPPTNAKERVTKERGTRDQGGKAWRSSKNVFSGRMVVSMEIVLSL